MKNKLKLRRYGLTILAICFYFLVLILVNRFLVTNQKQQIKNFGAEYQAEVVTSDHEKTFARWQKNFKLSSVDLPAEGNSELARVAKNATDHNLVNSKNPFTKVQYQGRTTWLYLVSDPQTNKGQAILVQPVTTIRADYLRTWIGFTIIYLLILMFLARLMIRHRQILAQKLTQLTENVKAVENHQEPESIILAPEDPLFELAVQVNELGTTLSLQITDAKLQKQSLRSLIENLPLGVMLIDEAGQVDMVNHALGEILNTPIWPDQLATYVDYVKTYALSRMIEHALRSPLQHTHRRRDIQLVGDAGRFVEADVISLVNQDGDTPKQKVLVMLYDITEIKQNERMQLDFVTNASHELRTPVTSIAGFAETLLDGAKDDPEKATEFITIIRDQAQHLEALIADILLLSKADQDRPLNWEVVDVDEVVSEEAESLQHQIAQKQLQVKIEAQQYQAPTLTDATKIRQIVRNLLTNAVMYNREDGEIKVTLKTTATALQLDFKDTGDGLTTEDQARIFERFYRADHSHQHDKGGTGLGLAIVANLVDQLGGQVSVKSQLGVGSIFTVVLPLNQDNR
ncbi:sensor histidine kinase [Lapidilactobacillus bayanensis]|uniref:sensor histidine kinase n=1 Tax=Lapidilactobacillus bayanensis TaxID=2485998 RepID=UPI000F7A9999|nr:ATP-binding protein [Lapidilactobacillus bayanensis]